MKRMFILTTIIAFLAVLAIGYNSLKLSACGPVGTGCVTKSGGQSQAMAAEKLENVHLEVTGMTCNACAGKIKSELAKIPAVNASLINWEKGTADVSVTPGSNHKALADAVKRAGFNVSSVACECGS